MNTLRRLMMKLQLFMSDRYARVDAICITCLIASVFLNFLSGFFGLAVYIVMETVSFALTLYAIYRPFSKNIWKREKENRGFSSILKKIKAWFLLNYRRVRYIKTSVFVKCPRCKAVIRFPRKKGEHMARCPGCSEKFKVNVRF